MLSLRGLGVHGCSVLGYALTGTFGKDPESRLHFLFLGIGHCSTSKWGRFHASWVPGTVLALRVTPLPKRWSLPQSYLPVGRQGV